VYIGEQIGIKISVLDPNIGKEERGKTMYDASRIRTTFKSKGIQWFGVWGVNNFYHKLEIQACSGAVIDQGYFLLIIVSGILATVGLLSNSAVTIVGSMLIAPFLGPSRAVCIGGLYLDRNTAIRGFFKQVVGLLIVGTGLAFVITSLLQSSFSGIGVTPEILLRAIPTERDLVFTLMVAMAAGAGASLAFTADPHVVEHPWGQLIDVMIGVEIAIALIPPASVIGIGLALDDLQISRNALALLTINILAIDFLGSMTIFVLRGLRRYLFDLERNIRKLAEAAVKDFSMPDLEDSIAVTLMSASTARVDIVVHGYEAHRVPDSLAERLATHILEQTQCRCIVTVELIPIQTFSTLSAP
jgi:uncharacterized hydrophobic protein (TIGR00271 family)